MLVSSTFPTDATRNELARLIAERTEVESKLSELAVTLSKQEVATVEAIRASIPAGAAWVAWADISDTSGKVQEHWCCVFRATGPPAWERLPGTGPDRRGPRRRRPAGPVPGAAGRRDGDRGRGGRLSPTVCTTSGSARSEKHLAGVRQLYRRPGRADGRRAGRGADRPVHRQLRPVGHLPRPAARTSPAAPAPRPARRRRPGLPHARGRQAGPDALPPGGLLVTQVVPGGDGRERPAPARRRAARATPAPTSPPRTSSASSSPPTPATSRSRSRSGGDGGQAGRPRPRRPASSASCSTSGRPPRRSPSEAQDGPMLSPRAAAADCAELPGTRVEVAAPGRPVRRARPPILARADASEPKLDGLRAAGRAGRVPLPALRHPRRGERRPGVRVGADPGPGPACPTRAAAGRRAVIDGRLSAREVLDDWELDAELVTLSACESGLGRDGGGEGCSGSPRRS